MSLILIGVTTLAGMLLANDVPPRDSATSTRPASTASMPATRPVGPRIVDFGEGIKINYIERQVEIEAEVILREGPLELFAYAKAPAPKEHETILLVRVKPHRVFAALGLVGATPGQPMRWFPETQTLREASGDPIDVLVRLGDGPKARTIHATDWMLDAANRRAMPRTHWLFCGSERNEAGGLSADEEGTVVTVVDFTTSLLALPQRHTSDDAELWLIANTDAIPPRGTRVALLLRPKSTTVTIETELGGKVAMNGVRHNLASIEEALRNETAGWIQRARMTILQSSGAESRSEEEKIRTIGRKLGLEDSQIEVKPRATSR